MVEKVWKYSKHGQKNVLGIISDGTIQTIKNETIIKDDLLEEEYHKGIEDFKKADKNFSKYMYETLNKLHDIGKQLKHDFTIKQLCKDLDITYERYKFYMKYEMIDEETKKLLDNKKISHNIVLNIIHRFPRKEWKKIIQMEVKYKLTKNDIIELRKNDAFKNKNNWDKIYDERKKGLSLKENSSNRRSIRTSCNNLIRELKILKCFNNPTKKKIYDTILETRNALDLWLKKNEKWKNLKAKR